MEENSNCVEVRVDAESDPTEFRKSSYSGGGDGSQCVELAHGARVALVRDSKNADGPRLRLPAAALRDLVGLARRC